MKIKLLGSCLLVSALLGSTSAMAFDSSASMTAVRSEISQRDQSGESMATIVSAAKTARISAGVLATSLVAHGFDVMKVVQTMISAGYPKNEVELAAIAAGADPTAFLPATAGGNPTGPSAGSPGFTPSRFGITRAATVSGGGRGSVSKS